MHSGDAVDELKSVKHETYVIPEPFLDFHPQEKWDITLSPKDSTKQSVAVFGDLHANPLNFIQRAVLSGHIKLSTEHFNDLAYLTESTVLDQLRQTAAEYASYTEHDNATVLAAIDSLNANRQHYQEVQQIIRDRMRSLNETTSPQYLSLNMSLQILLTQEETNKQQTLSNHEWLLKKIKIKKRYQTLLAAVQKNRQLFETIANAIEILDVEKFILLIGDELADRGLSDEDMLLLLMILTEKGVKIFSLLSNHALEIVYAFLMRFWNNADRELFLHGDYCRSLTNLRFMIQEGLIAEDRINQLMQSWINSLHLVTYAYDQKDNTLTDFTHAPVGWETIEALALKYGIVSDAIKASDAINTSEEAKATIDAIDQCFRESLAIDVHATYKSIMQMYYFLLGNPEAEIEPIPSDQPFCEMVDSIFKSFDYLINYQQSSEKVKQKINTLFATLHKSFVYQISDEIRRYHAGVTDEERGNPENSAVYFRLNLPLMATLWNRCHRPIVHQKDTQAFNSCFGNGHTFANSSPQRINLDSEWAKPFQDNDVQYTLSDENVETMQLECVMLPDLDTALLCYSCESNVGFIDDSDLEYFPAHHFSGVIQVRLSSPDNAEIIEAIQQQNPQEKSYLKLLPDTALLEKINMDLPRVTVVRYDTATHQSIPLLEMCNQQLSPQLRQKQQKAEVAEITNIVVTPRFSYKHNGSQLYKLPSPVSVNDDRVNDLNFISSSFIDTPIP